MRLRGREEGAKEEETRGDNEEEKEGKEDWQWFMHHSFVVYIQRRDRDRQTVRERENE